MSATWAASSPFRLLNAARSSFVGELVRQLSGGAGGRKAFCNCFQARSALSLPARFVVVAAGCGSGAASAVRQGGATWQIRIGRAICANRQLIVQLIYSSADTS